MKYLVMMLAVGALLFSFFVSAPTALARPAFEDPQLCVNGKLLRVDPTTAPIDVWVRVGSNVAIDFDVTHCGGNPGLPTVERDQVKTNGDRNTLEVLVKTARRTNVNFYYDRRNKTINSGIDGLVYIKVNVKK